ESTNTSLLCIIYYIDDVSKSTVIDTFMYGCKIKYKGTMDVIFYKAKHPYNWVLLGSMPKLHEENKTLQSIPVTPPDLKDPPKGCPFTARCPFAMKVYEGNMP